MTGLTKLYKSLLSFFIGNNSSRKGVLETDENRSIREVMNGIYVEKRWGGRNHDFYSGMGSHASKIVVPYVKCISKFLKTFENKPIVCDLGCGDFNVGKQLVHHASKYIGVDIVEELIKRNQEKFEQEQLEFRCLNIVDDELPVADCVLLRQILQHLSNSDISKVLEKLGNYKYVLLTEHVPGGQFIPNLDKRTGQSTRLGKGSGVVLTEPPFLLKPFRQEELLRLNLGSKGSQLVTTLYQNF